MLSSWPHYLLACVVLTLLFVAIIVVMGGRSEGFDRAFLGPVVGLGTWTSFASEFLSFVCSYFLLYLPSFQHFFLPYLPSFPTLFPSFLTFFPSFLPFLPSLPSFHLPYLFPSYLASFLPSYLPSFLLTLLASFLPTLLPFFFLSFHLFFSTLMCVCVCVIRTSRRLTTWPNLWRMVGWKLSMSLP